MAKNEFEKLDLKNMSAREAVYKAAKMYITPYLERLLMEDDVNGSIYLTHGESTKDKEFELEISWICAETKNRHEPVPKDLLDDAEAKAKEEEEDEEMGDAE